MDLVRRSGWGAAPPRGNPIDIATPVRDLFLHHSVTPDNGPDTVLAMQRFHQDTRGWADIAYTVIYSPKHRVLFEGRGFGIAGAHTRSHNRTSHGLCVLGNYDVTKPTDNMIEDLAEFARWHRTAYGAGTYRPHNDVSATKCPGDNLLAVLDIINLETERDYTPAYDNTPDIPPTLRLGSTGDDVKLLQSAIMPHDGVYGPQTEQAVRRYQAHNGLTVDGVCGPQTWRAILGL